MEKFAVTVRVILPAEDHEAAEKDVKLRLIKAGFEEIQITNTGMVWDFGGTKE